MLSQTKMQLWYRKSASEEKNRMCFENSVKEFDVKQRSLRNVNIESDTSDTECAIADLNDSDGDLGVFSNKNRSPQHSDSEETFRKYRKHTSFSGKIKETSDFIDLKYWRKEKLCCGTIFRGVYGEIMVDLSLIKPCEGRLAKCRHLVKN